MRRFVAQGDRAPRRRVGGGARVPARAVRPLRRAGLPRAQVPRGVRRPGRDLRPRRGLDRGAGALRRLGRGRRRAQRPRPDRDAAGLQVRHRGAAAALDRARDQGRADRRARDHRARRRLRRRRHPHRRPARCAGGYVVNGSKTFITNGVRADFLVCAVKTDAGGRPPRPLLPRPGAGDARLRGDAASSRRWAGTPPTPASSPSPTSRSPTRTCSARRTRAST